MLMQRLRISLLTTKDVDHFNAELPEKLLEKNSIIWLWTLPTQLWDTSSMRDRYSPNAGCWHLKGVV